MYNRFSANRGYHNVNQYLVKEIMDASPEELVIKVYDFAIAKAQQHNLEKANKAVQTLIDGLDYSTEEVKEISIGLLRLYKFCQDKMRDKEYDVVVKILSELRESWTEAIKKRHAKAG